MNLGWVNGLTSEESMFLNCIYNGFILKLFLKHSNMSAKISSKCGRAKWGETAGLENSYKLIHTVHGARNPNYIALDRTRFFQKNFFFPKHWGNGSKLDRK